MQGLLFFQVLGDRVVAAQKADKGLEETCLSVTTRFVAMLLKADREGPPPLLYDRRRHHDRTANWVRRRVAIT